MKKALLLILSTLGLPAASIAQTDFNNSSRIQPLPLMGNNTRPRIGLVVGAARPRLRFNDGSVLNQQRFDGQPAPVLGLGCYFPLPQLHENLGLGIDLLYTRENFKTLTFDSRQAGYGPEQQAHFRNAYLMLPVLLRYALTRVKVEPFVQLGVSPGYALELEGEYRYRSQLLPNDYTAWMPVYMNAGSGGRTALLERRRLAVGLVGSIGLGRLLVAGRPCAVELRAERTNGVTDGTVVASSITRFSALLHLGLTR